MQQVFISMRPPPLLEFYLESSCNFVGSESGQIKSVKLLQNIQDPTPPAPPPTTLPHTVFICCTLTQGRGWGGELNQREGKMGNSSQSWDENTNMIDFISTL